MKIQKALKLLRKNKKLTVTSIDANMFGQDEQSLMYWLFLAQVNELGSMKQLIEILWADDWVVDEE